jgi:hypothetical protein
MSAPTDDPGPRLAALGGLPCPPHLAEALRSLEVMPEAPRRVVWRLLGPALAEPQPASLGALGDAFAKEHELNPSRLALVIAGCRELLRAAVALGVDRDGLGRDLDAVLGQGSAARAVLLAGFASAEKQLSREYLRRAIERHGRHAIDFEWRVDQIAGTSFSRALRSPVLTLTFDVVGAGGAAPVTFSVLPDVAERLAGVLMQVVPKARPVEAGASGTRPTGGAEGDGA